MLRERSRARIITFIGPVGVGKSTQMRLVKEYLRQKNVRVTETYVKSNHLLTYILGRFLKTFGFDEKVTYEGGYTRTYPRRTIVRNVFPLWCFLDTLSISVKFLFTVQLPFWLGFTTLIEEGLSMTSLTYSVSFPRFFGTKPVALPVVSNLLGWTKRKNHIDIVLDANANELDRRRTNRNFRQNELSEFVAMQRKWIQQIDFRNAIFIDTTHESSLNVHKKIVEALEGTTIN